MKPKGLPVFRYLTVSGLRQKLYFWCRNSKALVIFTLALASGMANLQVFTNLMGNGIKN
ncbi:hypothetical protein [Cylindrospermum sp. FACHB-282]|uniref:hypothetical protein n=1 Tax=Cylindrospermum sp. FACHB-282 TaxID=2692794 RepID=UPI00168923CC|nr:hypothetical protein [Cylindrospermum sp. FACHB-282]MBD2384039.1 hypothetical protein [Cylindrospermum sp. FACHB-282]